MLMEDIRSQTDSEDLAGRGFLTRSIFRIIMMVHKWDTGRLAVMELVARVLHGLYYIHQVVYTIVYYYFVPLGPASEASLSARNPGCSSLLYHHGAPLCAFLCNCSQITLKNVTVATISKSTPNVPVRPVPMKLKFGPLQNLFVNAAAATISFPSDVKPKSLSERFPPGFVRFEGVLRRTSFHP